jgi:hypothetical protein
MPEAVKSIAPLDFAEATAEFVKWFDLADGTRLSSKVQLQDLRSENAGRGASMLLTSFLEPTS